jgi:hypothetical protein
MVSLVFKSYPTERLENIPQIRKLSPCVPSSILVQCLTKSLKKLAIEMALVRSLGIGGGRCPSASFRPFRAISFGPQNAILNANAVSTPHA